MTPRTTIAAPTPNVAGCVAGCVADGALFCPTGARGCTGCGGTDLPGGVRFTDPNEHCDKCTAAKKELASALVLIHQFLADPPRRKWDIFVTAGGRPLARYRLKAVRADPTQPGGLTSNRVWTVEGAVGSLTLRFEGGDALWCPSYGVSFWDAGALQAAHPEWFAQFPEARMPAEGDLDDDVLPTRKARKARKTPVVPVPGAGMGKVTAPPAGAVSRAAASVQGSLF